MQTGNPHCRWVRGNRKIAEGETEPGKKVDAASGHSVIRPTFIEHVRYAGYPSRHWGHRSGEHSPSSW